MAAPTIRGSTAPLETTSPTSPAGTQVGDLVIIVLWTVDLEGVPTHTLQAGYDEIRTHSHNDGATDARMSVACKIATSAGANAYTPYTVSGTGDDASFAGIVVLTAGTFDTSLIGDVSASVTNTTSSAPNPSSINTPVADCLVMVIAGWHFNLVSTANTVTAPAGYTETWEVAASAVVDLSAATKTVATATAEDPGLFTDNTNPVGSVAMTIAFRPAVSAVSGTAAITLGAVTPSSVGDVDVQGTASRTLAAITSSAAGSVPVVGASSRTLGAATASSAGTVPVVGAAARELGAITSASAGTVPIVGNAARTLGAATLQAAGEVAVAGLTSPSLGAIIATSAGLVPVVGAASATLGTATLEAAGQVAVVGLAAATVGAVTSSSGGEVAVVGAGAVTVSVTSAGAGLVAITGAAVLGIGAITADASAAIGAFLEGSLAATLAPVAASAAGLVPVEGTGAPAVGVVTSSAGVVAVVGAAAVSVGVELAATAILEVRCVFAATLGAVAATADAEALVVTYLSAPSPPSTTATRAAGETITRLTALAGADPTEV